MNKYESYLTMSLAYLELGSVAAAKVNHWDMYQQAVAYQMFHATELFLKFAILTKTQEEYVKEHDLNKLLKQCEELYPDEKLFLKLPFDFRQNTGATKEERKAIQSHVEQFKPRLMDQHLRYPANKNTGGYYFVFDSGYFDEMKVKFKKVGGEILATC